MNSCYITAVSEPKSRKSWSGRLRIVAYISGNVAASAYSSSKSETSMRKILQGAIVVEPSFRDELIDVLPECFLVSCDCKMVAQDYGAGRNPVAHIRILNFGSMGHAADNDRPPA